MASCPVFKVADLVGKKWTIVIVQEVALNGEKGFNAIFRRMKKVSPKLLAKRLKELEKAGIVEKKIFANKIPVRTSYKLTKKGKELEQIINRLKMWEMKYVSGLGCNRKECVNCPLY